MTRRKKYPKGLPRDYDVKLDRMGLLFTAKGKRTLQDEYNTQLQNELGVQLEIHSNLQLYIEFEGGKGSFTIKGVGASWPGYTNQS